MVWVRSRNCLKRLRRSLSSTRSGRSGAMERVLRPWALLRKAFLRFRTRPPAISWRVGRVYRCLFSPRNERRPLYSVSKDCPSLFWSVRSETSSASYWSGRDSMSLANARHSHPVSGAPCSSRKSAKTATGPESRGLSMMVSRNGSEPGGNCEKSNCLRSVGRGGEGGAKQVTSTNWIAGFGLRSSASTEPSVEI